MLRLYPAIDGNGTTLVQFASHHKYKISECRVFLSSCRNSLHAMAYQRIDMINPCKHTFQTA